MVEEKDLALHKKNSLLKKKPPTKIEKQIVAEEYTENDFLISTVLNLIELARSSYYYAPKGTKSVKRASEFVFKKDGSALP